MTDIERKRTKKREKILRKFPPDKSDKKRGKVKKLCSFQICLSQSLPSSIRYLIDKMSQTPMILVRLYENPSHFKGVGYFTRGLLPQPDASFQHFTC